MPGRSGYESTAETHHAAEGRPAASDSRTGQISSRAQGITGGSFHQQQQEPGSPGSGVAQVLSVDEERLVDNRMKRQPQNGSGNGSGGTGSSVKTENGSGSGSSGKQAGGVSLFGSYKAPIRRD